MKTAIFIDGSNVYMGTRGAFDIDWKQFRRYYTNRSNGLVQLLYYSAVLTIDGQADIRPLLDWLDYNGYTVVTKPTKMFVSDNGQSKIKGDMDVEIAIDMYRLAPHLDHIILYSGDGDFVPAVLAVQSIGVYVTIVSTMNVIADELRRAANTFIDLNTLRGDLSRASG